VVLVSGSGTLLQALIDAQSASRFGAEIVAVGSDREQVAALDRAGAAGIPSFVHELDRGANRAGWDVELRDLVAGYAPDLVVCAGFMKLLGHSFLDRFGGSVINSHPSLLPSFPGTHAVRDALAYGVQVTGATVFLVDSGVDSGVILAQAAVPVAADDSEDSLHERIKVSERELLVDIVGRLATTRWHTEDRKVRWDG
jgi:phosphoribosylglycinamide formyltransferase-1